MIFIIKKTNCNNIKEYKILAARGKNITVNGEEKSFVESTEQIGTVCLDEFKGGRLHAGQMKIGEVVNRLEFDITSIKNEDGRMRRAGQGKCYEAKDIQYIIEEKFHVKKSFWIFKSGYEYFALEDIKNQKMYKVFNITFASDMHYYYVYNELEQLVAAIYKPYRNIGEDEYHVYSVREDLKDVLTFFVSYVDSIFYPYNSALDYDVENRRRVYEDDAAYTISDDELLKLYDESFVRRVMENEA